MEETKNYVKKIASKFEFSQINELLNKLKNLSVLVIGDTIIDHYIFVGIKGRAIKDPILSVEYKNREIYAGGILAIANHLANFVEKIKLVTLVGDYDSNLDLINKSLNGNIELKSFTKENSPTTVKKRMVEFYKENKLFKIEYINDKPINNELTDEIVNYLNEQIPKYDLVVVGDFGHGFINEKIRRKLEEKSKFLALNVQSNSANMGYNYFNNYKKFDFICMNDEELRLPLCKQFEEINEVINETKSKFVFNNLLVTQGKKGCIFVNGKNIFKSPIITTSIKDTVGAGDALFTISSLLVYLGADNELIPFLANCTGGIAANTMGNKESVTKEKLLNFIKEVYENEME
jgi:rfaE bifunctional protein kinase chain/domain